MEDMLTATLREKEAACEGREGGRVGRWVFLLGWKGEDGELGGKKFA